MVDIVLQVCSPSSFNRETHTVFPRMSKQYFMHVIIRSIIFTLYKDNKFAEGEKNFHLWVTMVPGQRKNVPRRCRAEKKNVE